MRFKILKSYLYFIYLELNNIRFYVALSMILIYKLWNKNILYDSVNILLDVHQQNVHIHSKTNRIYN